MRAFKKAIQRVSRWAMAMALLPVLWVLCHQIVRMAPSLEKEGFSAWWLYAAGAAGYLAVEKLIARPMWLYVFGHELTHAVTGLLTGARVHSFKASSKGGEVHLSKSNVFIALSPYVVPFYAVVLVLVYAAARKWWNSPGLLPAFQVGLGAAIAFHFSHTFSALHFRQTDLKVMGFFLSGVLIAVGNTLIIGLLAVCLFQRTPSLREFALETTRETGTIYLRGLRVIAAEVKRLTHPPSAGVAAKDLASWTH